MSVSALSIAKAKLDIPSMAKALNWDWEAGRTCRVPYREDRTPSGSILDNGRLLHDFAEGRTLDAPALLAEVEGISMSEACRRFIALAGVRPGEVFHAAEGVRRKPVVVAPVAPGRKPALPRLVPPSTAEYEALSAHRMIPVPALREAHARGVLWAGDWYGGRCWFITDSSGWSAQARRLDGVFFVRKTSSDDWQRGPNQFKAWTVRGSSGGWPVGLPDAQRRDRIAVVEGGPDALSAIALAQVCGCADEIGVVAMLGASARLVPEALSAFRGKRVRLFPHVDKPQPRNGCRAGFEGAARWQEQLVAAGAEVTAYSLAGLLQPDGREVGDLNGLLRNWDRLAAAEPELLRMFDF